MPFGGKYARTPAEGMVAKIPVLNGEINTATIMTYGFNPELRNMESIHMALLCSNRICNKISCYGWRL